ncbi:MAG TPA: ABC transporter substrate-binding protein, partial [Aggregatilineales bacterium]|nr:ABC transporter substrate-binding protein [Aggregatilineales bacterium]
MFTIRRPLTLALIGVLTFGALSFTSVSAQSKNLVIGIAENTTSLDPARGFEPEGGIIEKAAYDTLVTFPADNVTKIIPNLATKWDISSDGLTYTFTLKSGIVFSSGNSMTADDVVFSWNRLIGVKGTPSFLASTIASVKASDTSTVVLTLNAP